MLMKTTYIAFLSGGIFLLGGVLVPIAIVVANTLTPPSPNETPGILSYRLLETYRRYRPEPTPMYSIDPDAIAEDCGYEKEAFSNKDDLLNIKSWSPYNGYFDLTMWISYEFKEIVKQRRAEQIERSFGKYEIQLLNGCINETLVASICANAVSSSLSAAGLNSAYELPSSGSRPKQTRRFKTVCTYLDGLVARRSGRLSMEARDSWPRY